MPLVHGKGRRKRKLGTRTWPETNFLVISYLDDEGVCAALSDAELI
jgi:hypothetical protein